MARILTTLMRASNPQTPCLKSCGPILLDLTVWFILRAAMSLRFKLRTSRLLLFVAAFFIWGLAGTPEALAQRLPKATGREPENRSAPARRETRRKARRTAPAASRNPAAVESDNFLDLGDSFRAQKKWRAAEAAYKEAVNIWPANAEALLELGFLYLDRNKIDEAQQTYGKLRSVNASYASDLLAEINRRKTALAH
jgi:tetratricopeptide (TPR) repeat protein